MQVEVAWGQRGCQSSLFTAERYAQDATQFHLVDGLLRAPPLRTRRVEFGFVTHLEWKSVRKNEEGNPPLRKALMLYIQLSVTSHVLEAWMKSALTLE